MDKRLSYRETTKEKMMDAWMEYAGNCYLDHVCNKVDAEKERFYQEITFPPELDARVKKLIRYRQFREDFFKALRKGSKVLSRAAILLIAVCLSLGVLAATSEAARIKILNFIIEAENEFTKIRFQDSLEKGEPRNTAGMPGDWSNVYSPEYIPEGFGIIDTETYTSAKIIYYANEKGEQIEFDQYTGETMELRIDTQTAQVEKILINGLEGLMAEKEGFTTIVWHNQEDSFYLASEIEGEELLKMAKSVKK